jgi:1,4-alpha-glucan branching enzyme
MMVVRDAAARARVVRPPAVRRFPLAIAASVAAFLAAATWALTLPREPSSAAQAAPPVESVQFVLVAPGASAVTLVGDFNDWDFSATPLQPAAPGGLWSVTIALPAGRHHYAFVVNGREWRADPVAPSAPDDFGTQNSVVTVGDRSS